MLSGVHLLTDVAINHATTLKDMGGTRDYYKPTRSASFCEMLRSNVKHQWSPNAIDWKTPPYANDGHNGGSEVQCSVFQQHCCSREEMRLDPTSAGFKLVDV
jgi:hypothetical protein